MTPYLMEWLNLIVRFAHVIVGIAWIGASFYFVWLDNHLQTPPEWKSKQGIKGDLWAIHGGGFYEVAKYQLAPPSMPHTLHWFKWEAYSTWLTGFLLMSLMFYVGAESYLIDPRVAQLSQIQAISYGLMSIVVGVASYELLCRTSLKHHSGLLSIILLLLLTALAYFLTQVFSGRGAYMHVGAIMGTVMAGNVFFGIIPAQKALVAAVNKAQAPDEKYGLNAKLRSTHNTYITLPVIFIMISNHYPITFNHEYSWLILMVMVLISAVIRQYFVLRHVNQHRPLLLIAAVLALLALAYVIAPKSREQQTSAAQVSVAKIEQIITQRCTTCHSATPTDAVFQVAPAGVMFDDMRSISQWASRINSRTAESRDMPLLNKTQITEQERQLIAQWFLMGAPQHD
jgi:uncharacterized membrane protein